MNDTPASPDAINPRDDIANLDAERAVLGSLLLNRDAIPLVARVLQLGDFTSGQHRTLYAVILELFERRESPDTMLVLDTYAQRGLACDAAWLFELTHLVPHGLSALAYAERVREASTRRRFVEAAQGIVQRAYRVDVTPADLATQAAELVQGASADTVGTGYVALADALSTEFDGLWHVHGKPLKTGWPDLDSILGGIKAGQLVLIAARPSIGKSAMAMQLVDHVTKAGTAAGVISLEMTAREMIDRLVAIDSGVNMFRLRTYAGTDAVSEGMTRAATEAFARLHHRKLYLQDSSTGELADVLHHARRMRHEARIELLIVDHIHLMTGNGENRNQEISRISRGLKLLAKELGIPVVALAQLNRQVELRADNIPMLADLRDSGSLEQDADVVVLLHRETVARDNRPMPSNEAKVIVAKHRNGPTGLACMVWRPETASFVSESNRMDAR